jgi:hypothetical protein
VQRLAKPGFPLILTFSHREKEPPLVSSLKFTSAQAESRSRFAKTLGALLPLPKGEGRGEGKEDTAAIRYVYYGNAT